MAEHTSDPAPSAGDQPPVSFEKLQEITDKACTSALAAASGYDHALTPTWNDAIINSILQSLISENSTPDTLPTHKFVVNSTIVQHAPSSTNLGLEVARRGVHSAVGAYWSDQKDGMWNYRYEEAVAKGIDVVVHILWIAR